MKNWTSGARDENPKPLSIQTSLQKLGKITHHQFLSYFDPRALFLQKQGPQKPKGGKANVLNNSKILRRSFFSKKYNYALLLWHQH